MGIENMAQSDEILRGPSGLVCQNLDHAIKAYMENNYPDFQHPKGAYFFPPFIQPDYMGPLGEASGALPEEPEHIHEHMKGWTNENKVMRSLADFDQLNPQPMFVFSKFKFIDLKHWLEKDHGNKGVQQFPNCHHESDILIVHQKYGVIIIEIKSSDYHRILRDAGAAVRDPCVQLKKVKQNLEKSHYFTKASKARITLVHAYPSQDMPDESEFCSVCNAWVLDKRYFENTSKISKWFDQIDQCEYDQYEANRITYTELVPRLIAGRSAIKAYVELTDFILKQTNLKGTYMEIRKNRERRNFITSVRKSEGDVELKILADEWKFLNPEQYSIWSGSDWQLFSGPYGTGKTILVQYKALQMLVSNFQILLITSYPLSEEYRRFFQTNEQIYREKGSAFGNWTVLHFDVRKRPSISVEDQLRQISSANNLRIFIDEAQCGEMDKIDRILRSLNPSVYWIAVISDEAEAVQGLVAKNISTDGRAHVHLDLSTCMRCTQQIFKFWSHDKGEDARQLLQRQESKKFLLGHQVQGPKVTILRTRTLRDAIRKVAEIVRDMVTPKMEVSYEKKIYAQKSERKYNPKEIIITWDISTFDPKPKLNLIVIDSVTQLIRLLSKDRIPVCSLTEHAMFGSEAITLSSELFNDELSSFEWHVVIMVCQKSKDFYFSVLPSRCVFELICIKYAKFLPVHLGVSVGKLRKRRKRKKHRNRIGLL